MTKKFIFNCSMPRAGSELLQVILHQNPKIYGSSTSPLLEYQFGARTNYNLAEVKSQDPQLMKDAFISMCSFMAQGYYEAITDRPIICDKNRGWTHYWEFVNQWNPNPKMICMVRDLRSIVASMERIYRNNRHNPEGPDNPAQLQNMTVSQRVQYWLSSQPIRLALQRTLDLFQRDIAKNIFFIRYEDLCSRSEEILKGLYDYLEEEPYEHDFSNIVKTVQEDDSYFGIFGSHSVKSQIKPIKPSDWSDVLIPDIANSIRKNNDWYFSCFNY